MSTKGSVYILQESKHLNFAPALEWGNSIVPVFPTGDVSSVPTDKIKVHLAENLADFEEQDYLILSGDPELLAIALLVLYELNNVKSVQLLKYDRITCSYKVRKYTL